MDIRKRLQGLKWSIQKPSFMSTSQGGISPEEEVEIFAENTTVSAATAKAVKNRTLPLSNPHKEKEVLDSIETCFYKEEEFDPSAYELSKLPEVIDINEITKHRKSMKEQLSVVSKKMSDLILENHPSYAAELQKVTELQKLLLQAYDVCYRARSNLQESQEETSTVGLKILAYHRKIGLYKKILSGLRTIKTLQETDFRLRELLEEGNYSGAIQLCLECQKAAEIYKHYNCISELSCKLTDTLSEMEEQLDRALASMALNFDTDRYRRLQTAYALLGKEEQSNSKLLNHFGAAIHNSAISILAEFASETANGSVQNGGLSDSSPETETGKLRSLCARIPPEKFLECFSETCRLLWKIMHNYHCVLGYHINEEAVLLRKSSLEDSKANSGNDAVKKLWCSLSSVWNSALHVINTLLGSTELSGFKFDNFLEVVSLANTFVRVGKKNFGADSLVLRESVNRQTVSYFKCYHRARLEEFKIFLESEAWEICPVSKGFKVYDLPEFDFLKNGDSTLTENWTLRNEATVGPETEQTTEDIEIMDAVEDNPFRLMSEMETKNGISANDENTSEESSEESDVADELKQDFVEDGAVRLKKHKGYKSVAKMSPILCNTALNLLRLFGRYLHMVRILKSIGFEVMTCLAQLFDFYFYTIWRFFGSDSVDFNLILTSGKLSSALKRTEQTLVDNSGVLKSDKIPAARLSPVIKLNHVDNLFGLAWRTVGIESLCYVSEQISSLQSHMEEILPKEKRPFVLQFSQSLMLSSELRVPVYGAVAARSLNFQQLLQRVSGVNWDISELMSQHSPYVDFLVQNLHNFRFRLDEVSNSCPIPREGYDIMWEVCIKCINRVLVEGYACAKKCTNEGRALMQLDFQQLIRKLETVTEMRPIPDKEYVENYVKGYYLPESAIDGWISEHKEYSVRQVLSLLNVATHISRKTRNRISVALEESISPQL